jgi:hypothetical protein
MESGKLQEHIMSQQQGETNMALIACPDCHKQVSDQARTCLYCGLPVAARLTQMRREEEERLAEQEALQQRLERQRNIYYGVLTCSRS